MSASLDQHNDAASLPVPSSTSLPNEYPPESFNWQLFIDKLGHRYCLSNVQIDDLKTLHQIATSCPEHPTPVDLMTKLFILASQFGIEQRALASRSMHATDSNAQETREFLKELAVQYNAVFDLSKDQKATIRKVCQGSLYKPSRTSYMTLYTDVTHKMEDNPSEFRMTDIFGNAGREEVWAKEVRRVCSATRGAYRLELRDSLFGPKCCMVTEFCTILLTRHRLTGRSFTEQAMLVHNVLLRRFCLENYELFGKGDSNKGTVPEEVDSDSNSDSDQEAASNGSSSPTNSSQSQKRRRLPAGRGRIAKGRDFWSKVDKWFQRRIKEMGNDFSSADWKKFISESLKRDNEKYTKKSPIKVASALPISTPPQPTPYTPSTTPNFMASFYPNANPPQTNFMIGIASSSSNAMSSLLPPPTRPFTGSFSSIPH